MALARSRRADRRIDYWPGFVDALSTLLLSIMFLLSVFVMSGATLGMGLVPSYASWGVAASMLMVTLRLIQGFCLGGELPGALIYVVETAPRIAPLVCGVVFACVTMGVAAATGVSLTVRTLLDPAVTSPVLE